MYNSDSDNSPINKKQKNNTGEMAGRGKRPNERSGDRRNSLDGGSSKDILDALEALRNEFTTQLSQMNVKLDKLEQLGAKVDTFEKTMGLWERRFKQLEVDEKRKWLVIKGLWKQDDVSQFETRKQLGASLEDLKQILGVKTPFMEYYRLKDIKRNNETLPGLVKVKFVTTDEKDFFFSRVSQSGASQDLKLVSFQSDIPTFLVEDYKRLDGIAFKLRKTDKLKTRIISRNLGLILQSRARTDGSKWTTVNPDQRQNCGVSGSGGGAGAWTED